MSNFKKVLEETMKAYTDCNSDNREDRNLEYRSNLPLTGEEFIKVMKAACPDGYNYFDEASAKNITEAFGKDAEYYVARESSVCVYVKVKRLWLGEMNTRFNEINADEIQYVDGMFRLWFD